MDDHDPRTDDDLKAIIAPHTMLPVQFWDRVNLEASAYPERRLMLAVLEEAIATFQRHLRARDRRGQRLFREAEEWIASPDVSRTFAFENICAALGIETEYMRRGLVAWKALQLQKHVTDRAYRTPHRRVNGRRHSISVDPGELRTSA